jgi:type IV fimbrial biogenesis protein FimT
MIVIALAAVILAIGAPSFNEFRRNARLAGPANDFLAAAQLARTEAIKRQRNISICPTAAPATDADPQCTAGPFVGWIVFEDADRDCTRGDDGQVLSHSPPNIGAGADRLSAASDGRCVPFAPSGFLDQGIAGRVSHLVHCDARGNSAQGGTTLSAARGLIVTPNGRVSITRDIAVIDRWNLQCPAS